MIDRSKYVRRVPADFDDTGLVGATVYGADDHKVGKISHLHGVGPGAQAVIDVGGFLGIGAKPVAVPLTQLDLMVAETGEVDAVTAWTKDDLKAMPEHHH